ncbi:MULTISPECIES: DNA methyltransferase [Enterococcus]|jgi:adenine-specific DNA-methyltransferase|uniref:DNA methyltransferase n=1 Tax=Enterococcus TaxID=1350 RepID=UPI0008864588|nr:site-specific DNA-methyltransferase [Enterococcus casseliflavus]SDK67101.1 adenine-specific DNA-methyltransferase [Enterococcus casseliflavus]
MPETVLLKETQLVLSKFHQYWDNEVLLKNKVVEDLRSYNSDLITALLTNKKIREQFEININGTSIFKIEEFIQLFTYKDFWEDSYTKFSNKIGLTAQGKYLDYDSDIVLDFPFKDCILEGGMTKEDLGKKEVYYNKVIARDEVDTLLSPKVFTNTRKYTKDGEEEVSKITATDNLIIKGNNLLALHSLKKKYAGKVKLVYIDVPYYFKKKISEDSFKYNSNFRMSSWLVFLKNRLEVAKELLSEKGSIWINISEDGMHYLKVMADEIFGKEKFVGTLPRKIRDGKSDVPFNFSQDFDWILIYTKGTESDTIVGRSVERQYIETGDFPNRPWRKADLTKQTTVKERPNSDFTMINPRTGKEYPVNPNRSWAVSKETFTEWYEKGGIGFPDDYDFMSGNTPFRRIFKDEDEQKNRPSSVISDFLIKDFITTLLSNAKNKKGNEEIDTLFSRDSFNYAKPEILIEKILEVSTNEQDLVLDFFMGSATTQAVAMKMNRQFIGIEQMDYINTVSVPRLIKVMQGESGGISKNVGWQGGGSFIYTELMDLNNIFIKDIQKAETTSEIFEVLKSVKKYANLNYLLELEKLSNKSIIIDENTKERLSFKDLGLEKQKKLLIDLMDINQLYVNYSEIDDQEYNVSIRDKAFNFSFYEDGVS